MRTAVASLVLAGLLCLVGWLLEDKYAVEKTLIRLAMPIGGSWLLLGGWILQRLVARRPAWFAGGLWIAVGLAATQPLSNGLQHYLEMSEPSYRPADGPLDLVIVLGGGTHSGPFRPQVGSSGDRVVFAAELYQQGLVKRLIATGESIEGRPGSAEQSIAIWTKLGIERADIGTLGGRNTFEEIQALKTLLAERPGQRVGLLTSAWHLPRAMRLARSAGLDLTPVAADYRFDQRLRHADFIPNAESLAQLMSCQHELMARVVSR